MQECEPTASDLMPNVKIKQCFCLVHMAERAVYISHRYEIASSTSPEQIKECAFSVITHRK